MNREGRLVNEELMAKFPELLLAAHEVKTLLSSEHFSVDGTLLRAWASHSSLERIDGLDDGPPPTNGGKGFGGASSAKKGFLNKARLAAVQWMSALFGVKMCVNGPN